MIVVLIIYLIGFYLVNSFVCLTEGFYCDQFSHYMRAAGSAFVMGIIWPILMIILLMILLYRMFDIAYLFLKDKKNEIQ